MDKICKKCGGNHDEEHCARSVNIHHKYVPNWDEEYGDINYDYGDKGSY